MEDIKIGLEVHGYLQTKEKLFCRCKASRHLKKAAVKHNTYVCPICTGQPGSKPLAPNTEAIKKIIQIALMLNCKINSQVKWQRKHYDWPDLPKGYQDTISGSYSVPVGERGNFGKVGIIQTHLEEDPAAWNPETGCIDYNRSGLPLVEIVTSPDFKSAEQVEAWLKKLVLTLSYIKALDKNAGIKVDVNISIGEKAGGKRVEVKNMSSTVNIKKAIEYEISRQRKEKTSRETRRFDDRSGKTSKMREKEEAADYRFIPDPDLPILKISSKRVSGIKSKLPETPVEKLQKLIKKHKIDKKSAEILYANFELVEFFEKVVEKVQPRFALDWVTIELLRVLNYNKAFLEDTEIKAEHFIELLEAVKQGKLTELKAKRILNEFFPKSFSIKNKLKSESRITSEKEIERICLSVINKNKDVVQDFREGKKEAFNFLIGEIMKASNRRADFQIARKVLERLLKTN
ncbi:MAG: Asp-tRNA(Asn)/Glu-tRNA(Gln) amidotransferase subunit GatB [archaeon]